VITLLALLLLATLGVSLVLVATVETMIAASYRDSVEGLYAADAGIERAVRELAVIDDWTRVLGSPDGVHSEVTSVFLGPTLVPLLGDGRPVDLRVVTNQANCPQVLPATTTPCDPAAVMAITSERPWGANNPHWRLYAHGAVGDLLPGRVDSPFYVAVWVGDDPAETDADPGVDGAASQAAASGGTGEVGRNPGRGVVQVRAQAFGPRGAHRAVEVVLARVSGDPGEKGYTGQRGRDERNTQGSRLAVRTSGAAPSRI
jgi:hypothetical protein